MIRQRQILVWKLGLRLAVLLVLSLASNSCAVLDGFLSETRIVFHGVVVDQFGTPVEDACVNYEIESFSLPRPGYRRGIVKTGKDGKFTIRDGRGSRFFINDIICERFAYPLSGPKLRGYEFRSSYTDCFRPDPKKPEIFRLRKKEKESVFLSVKEKYDIEQELKTRREALGFIWKQNKMIEKKNSSKTKVSEWVNQ